MAEGYALPQKYIDYYLAVQKLYEQQKYMFDNNTHRVDGRIVSISQPYIRPIVRGKARSPVEFGARYDVSIDEKATPAWRSCSLSLTTRALSCRMR